ncbi:MAG: hypothetical protein KIT83_05485 [Bryobacterales bacterium]|nr:hypothetical protein [Bryobacterales bacterium]
MDSFYLLQPNQDLQCYFEQPSAIAAMSSATPQSFRVSGEWRQQFDWCVIEWNRDNPIDHPLWRNLPNGDLTGITLSYDERRHQCIPMDSSLFPTVEWDKLRVWTEHQGQQHFHKVSLLPRATAIGGSYSHAHCTFTLTGAPATGDYIGLSWHTEHRTHQAYANETAESVVQALADAFNAFPAGIEATASGNSLELWYVGLPDLSGYRPPGANGNRVGIYSYVKGQGSLAWNAPYAVMSEGASPDHWRVELPFASLLGDSGETIDWAHVRKLRWTYAAPVSAGAFTRQEFLVEVDNWQVSGSGRLYSFAGAGSRRFEDDNASLEYTGQWSFSKGNYSGGSIHWTVDDHAEVVCRYFHSRPHDLMLGARALAAGGDVAITINGELPITQNFFVAGEDALVRRRLQSMPEGNHEIRIRKAADGTAFYFDFLEIAHLETSFNPLPRHPQLSLSTDWDTDHSLTISPERTLAQVLRLGFGGRLNHYVGAMWFYQMKPKGYTFAEGTVTFFGDPVFGETTELRIGNLDYGPTFDTGFSHINRVGDSAASIALAFALRINDGSTAIRAQANGAVLTILSRRLGTEGNKITIAATTAGGDFVAATSGATLSGGVNGDWITDIEATPRLNRAYRDWHRAYFAACAASGIDCVSAYSTELRHGDPSVEAGLAQRYWDNAPVLLNTPAIQTNFSPICEDYWKEVHRETAALMADGGLVPYLQLGEVQYWYFPNAAGMPYYDHDAMSAFQALFGRPMARIANQYESPSLYADELAFLRNRLGAYCTAIIDHVRATLPATRFEVLYPPDVNDSPIGEVVNFPELSWTPQRLDCLKTESFVFTLASNIEKSKMTIGASAQKGFPLHQRAHLVGIGDYTSSWRKEIFLAADEGLESVTLFALDQMCLIGYRIPLRPQRIHLAFQG